LEKRGIPRILANFISILILIATVVGFLFLLYKQLSLLLGDFPELMAQAHRNLDKLNEVIEKNFGVSSSDQNIWLKERLANIFATGSAFINTAFQATTGTIAKLGLLPVYIFFLLYYRNKFSVFLFRVVHRRHHQTLTNILNQIGQVTKRYMSGMVIVVLVLCVLNSVGLLIVGVKYAVLLGVIAAIINFIPYFGTLIGGAVPLSFALLVMDSPTYALGVIILFIIIQFLENNILTPNIVGGNVNINPFFTILSIVVGGMMWGLPGMIISLPFMSMFRIVCDNIPKLKPIAYLLGTSGTEHHSVTLDGVKQSFRKICRRLGIVPPAA
jgi:predicted PurR-regulated permease PerM